jgi:hypothetical protein
MTLSELRELLDRLGIVLSVRGDRLHYQAPHGTMTPDLRATLAEHKAALLVEAGQAGPTADPMDLIVNAIARRRGATVIEIDGGRIVEPGPAGLTEAAAPGPDEPPPLSDAEVLAAIDRAFDPAWWSRPPGADHGDRGPRDVRRGDRWLPWHFTAEFEDRMRRER